MFPLNIGLSWETPIYIRILIMFILLQLLGLFSFLLRNYVQEYSYKFWLPDWTNKIIIMRTTVKVFKYVYLCKF